MNQYEFGIKYQKLKRTKFSVIVLILFSAHYSQSQVLNNASGVSGSGSSFTTFYEWIGEAFLSHESLYTPQACTAVQLSRDPYWYSLIEAFPPLRSIYL